MNREILFRGKNEAGWICGDLIHESPKVAYIKPFLDAEYPVDPKTVGQYTGLKDKNGKRIFEGDMVSVDYNSGYGGIPKRRLGRFEVVFLDGCFMKKAIADEQLSFFENVERTGHYHFCHCDGNTIIGNIYDNPELMKGEESWLTNRR